MKKFITALTLLALTAVLFMSCYTPSPLYGTWTDNDGDSIIFVDDNTFTAKIVGSDGKAETYSGTWSTVDNVLIFNISGDVSFSRNTEWDIRGAILYCTWTANNITKVLTLYHTAR